MSNHSNFQQLGVSPKLVQVLNELKFVVPTPIQEKTIPEAIAGSDIIGIAQTGTGKTLAFMLPMLEKIAKTKRMGLIVLPTRELAEQAQETLRRVGRQFNVKSALLIGGASMGRQIEDLRRRPHVIVGTPGRINDHLQRRTLKLDQVGILVLDEADRMLDMGFAPQVQAILTHMPQNRQTLLFSATMPPAIESIAAKYMKQPKRIQTTQEGTVAEQVKQALYIVPSHQKNRLLDKVLSDYSGTVLVFSRTKYGAKKLCRVVRNMKHTATEIHSNLSPAQRRRSLVGFKSGAYRVMVATDIAARGIDVSEIELVINYDLPDQLSDYIHRVGRTGRAGEKGMAISFVAPEQRRQIREIERLVRQRLPVAQLPDLPMERVQEREVYSEDGQSRGRRNYQQRRRNGGNGRRKFAPRRGQR